MISRFEVHSHTEFSNARFLDCINKPKELIQRAKDLGLSGIAITDHECLSAGVRVNKIAKEMNFKVALGNEIYLTDTRATKTYFEESYEGRVALIVGSERYGITKPWYDGDYEMIMIPMLGQCDSLNVAIATTIIAYEASLKQKGFMKGEKR